YKRLAARGRELKPLKKMTIGMYISPAAFLCAFALQRALDGSGGTPPHALWQWAQYFFLSLAEVLISITGLEFAFTQAPMSMKSVVMGVWFLCISLGAQLSALVTKGFSRFVGEPMNWQLFY